MGWVESGYKAGGGRDMDGLGLGWEMGLMELESSKVPEARMEVVCV